jgi:starch-binding outer membrane protein, SusD/RagB family
VIGDLECAWSAYSAGAVMISDQVIQASGNLNQRNWGSRRITADDASYSQTSCAGAYGLYTPLHTARFQAEDVFRRLSEWTAAQVPTRTSLQAIVKVYGAYALVALAEGFCEMAIDGGPLLKPTDVLQLAKQRFTEGLALATQANNTDMRNMANVGLARVNLDLGDFTAAITAASAVTPGYVKNATRDETSTTRYNALCANFTCATFGRNASIAPTYRGVTWQGVPDPRVNVTTTNGLAADNSTVLYFPVNKSNTRSSPMPIASYKEAQLVIAEANARLGNLAPARTIINALHTAAGIPGYDPTNTATQTQVINQVIEERRRELFLEGGHRLNDHLRFRGTPYNVPFKGEPGSFDPNGVDRTGLPYGSTTCFPLPTVERVTNPNIP